MTELTLDRISHRYERHRLALQDVTLCLGPGVWGLVGPNGAGKTTLLRILATLLVPTGGSVRWNGQDILRRPQLLRQDLGYLPQDLGAYPQLSAVEFLRYVGALKGLSGVGLTHRVEQALELVNLAVADKQRLRSYSGGMLRRLGIAQALLTDPPALLLDEPTAGLDPVERVRFRELIAALPGERLVLLSTHIITDIDAMATDLLLLQRGQARWSGTPQALQQEATGSVWEVTVDAATFDRVRSAYQISQAIRRGDMVKVRLIAATRPLEGALAVEPSLEEAYLCLTGSVSDGNTAFASFASRDAAG
jgi:ABC-type multidrug transport system ATPase subunit